MLLLSHQIETELRGRGDKASLRRTPEEGRRIADPRKQEAPASRRESRGRSPQGKEVWSRVRALYREKRGDRDSDGRREDYQRREGWGCQGSAPGKCHSEPGEGRVRT